MTLRQLSSRKAALTRHYGDDDPRTLKVAAALRQALLKKAIEQAVTTLPPMTDAERDELTALLAGADA